MSARVGLAGGIWRKDARTGEPFTITGRRWDEDIPIPDQSDFIREGELQDNGEPRRWLVDYLVAPELEEIAAAIIRAKSDVFQLIREARIAVLWRQKGGDKLAAAKKPRGYEKETGADFLIWVARDNAHDYGFKYGELEAILLHELSHCTQDHKNRYVLRPHEFEGFAIEFQHYGPWRAGMPSIAMAVQSSFDDLGWSCRTTSAAPEGEQGAMLEPVIDPETRAMLQAMIDRRQWGRVVEGICPSGCGPLTETDGGHLVCAECGVLIREGQSWPGPGPGPGPGEAETEAGQKQDENSTE